MGSETSKHKLVTLDQVANVPPTLKQQTLIKACCLLDFSPDQNTQLNEGN
jgi:hypothetical protein